MRFGRVIWSQGHQSSAPGCGALSKRCSSQQECITLITAECRMLDPIHAYMCVLPCMPDYELLLQNAGPVSPAPNEQYY